MMRGISAALVVLLGGCPSDDDVESMDASMDAGMEDSSLVDATEADAQPDAAPPPFAPDRYCPGSAECPDEGDDVLYAGVAMRDITPPFDDTVETLSVDTNGDGIWDPFDGDEFDDRNDDGRFDGIFIAGFGSPRIASGVHDPQWARALVLRHNETTIALVALDTFSLFLDNTDRVREQVADLGIDYVAMFASHSHQATDNLGIYGLDETSSGVDPEYLELFEREAAAAIREAYESLVPSHIQYATFRFRDQPGGVSRYISDSRHPRIIDDEARIFRLLSAEGGDTIATVVNFGSHAEYWGDTNTLLSSDFPHTMRLGIEEGVLGPDGEMVPGVGGMAFFVEGAIGSQIGPNEIHPARWDGTSLPRSGLETMEELGRQFAYFVLRAIDDQSAAITDETAQLGFRQRRFYADVQNAAFHIAILNDLFIRESYNWDPGLILRAGDNEPDVQTEVALIDIGRLHLQLIPGEIDPALFLGGYDGSFTPDDVPILDEGVENSPDLSRAPEPPYLRDLAPESAEYVGILSLANDHIGYLLPDFDFVLDPRNPYIDEAPGEHYEETNSLGMSGWSQIKSQMTQLLAWRPEENL